MPAHVSQYLSPDDRQYAANNGLYHLKPELGSTFEVTITSSQDSDWLPKATAAFHFLRANATRRYSSQALMAVLGAAERTYHNDDKTAWVITVESPYNYDPDTEVKSGGVVGTLVQLNDGTCRALLAVAPCARRNGVGKALLSAHSAGLGGLTAWVSRNNRDAQQFLLSQSLHPMTINSAGAVRYGNVDWEEFEV